MKKIRCYVSWPIVGAQDEEYIIEVEDDTPEDVINEFAADICKDLIYNRVSCGWEEV